MQGDHWTRKMTINDFKQKVNGYGTILRFVTPLLLMLVAFNAKEIFNDVKFIKENMVLRSTYTFDKGILERVLTKLDDRIREVEKDVGRK